MRFTSKAHCINLCSAFFTGSNLSQVPKTNLRLHIRPISITVTQNSRIHSNSSKKISFWNHRRKTPRVYAVSAVSKIAEKSTDVGHIESLFSYTFVDEGHPKRGKRSSSGASSVSSGIRLENITKSFKGVSVLKDVSWEVKKREKVGLVGVNGAGETTQMRIIVRQEEPDSGNVIKAKPNMKIAFLSQEFEVCPSRTVNEEFMSVFKEEMEIAVRLEKVQKALESSVEDLGLMGRVLDELDVLQRMAQAVDLDEVDAKMSKMMPELGFAPEDSKRLVASFSSG